MVENVIVIRDYVIFLIKFMLEIKLNNFIKGIDNNKVD